MYEDEKLCRIHSQSVFLARQSLRKAVSICGKKTGPRRGDHNNRPMTDNKNSTVKLLDYSSEKLDGTIDYIIDF